MGFTLRFMLGFALVLTTCSISECASSWRHVRQASPPEDLPEASILGDRISNLNESKSGENVINHNGSNNTDNNSNKTEGEVKTLHVIAEKQNIANNGSTVEKKPKTENNTEKQVKDNKIDVYKISDTNDNGNSKPDKEEEKKVLPLEVEKLEEVSLEKLEEVSLEKPELKDSNTAANSLKKEQVENEQKAATEKVPEVISVSSASRLDGARSLDIDINKYVSPEFHNKNNVYSLSVSPDTEKYTNLHNELPKSTTSRLQSQEPSKTIFGAEPTTPLDEDFDKKFQHIEEGVKQKLEYIDHQFPDTEHDFKKPDEDETIHIEKLLDEPKHNDTTIDLSYTKFTNINDNYTRDKSKIHKELDVESGQNIDYRSVYNRTQVYGEPPKDYKNKIPIHEDDIKPDIPEHSETKVMHKLDGKETDVDTINEKVPEVNVKESTSLTKPPPLNKTNNNKSLLSNNIETEVPNPAENNMKVEWDFPYSSTSTTTPTPTTKAQTGTTSKSGQSEEISYVPYGKENFINVSKRGSTKYVDTVKIATTTESIISKKSRPSTTPKSRLDFTNKQLLANKENKTMEQAVLENQVYPIQIPSPNGESKEEKSINHTTEKTAATENSVIPLKPQTSTNTASSASDDTRIMSDEEITTTQAPELTTYSKSNLSDLITVVTTMLPEESTKYEVVTELTTREAEVETITISENFTTVADIETITSTTVLYTTDTETENATVDLVTRNNEFKVTTYRIDTSGSTEDDTVPYYTTVNSETTSVGETTEENAYYPSITENQDYADNKATTLSYEDNSGTSFKYDEHSESDERFNNGRDLKTNSSETSTSTGGPDYPTVEDDLNNFDLSTTTESISTVIAEHDILINQTKINATTQRTGDYKENVIIKQPESIGDTTKAQEEASHELLSKHNLTETDNVDEGSEDISEDDIDPDAVENDHTTFKPRIVQPHEGNTSETTPLIIPLNASMVEIDTTDSTTADNLGLQPDDKVEGSGGKIAAIVISCIGAACLIILAGLLIVMRKRHKRFNYGQRCTPVSLDAYSVDNVSVYNSMRRKGAMRASKRSYGNPAFDDPTSTTHSLNFPALAKFANNSEGIAAEFEEIPQVTAQMNELPEGCETKNRYANVIPLPETRVFLNSIDGYPNSDYINANFVTGPKSIRGYYIACQAPLQSTVDDFWRMVWEQQSKVILMLTHLFENGTEKCVDYLPPSEVLDCHRLFGDFQVTLKKREVKEKYVISSLQLKNMVSNSWREVTHLWYLGWPEKGVPSEANSLIAFLIEARSYVKSAISAENGKPKEISNEQTNNGSVHPEQSPLIVHCSPGTGRTGTVIACDIAIREFELTRQVDIPKTVYRIRRDRASSVQTKEQYEFIYKVISLYATKLTGGVLDSL